MVYSVTYADGRSNFASCIIGYLCRDPAPALLLNPLNSRALEKSQDTDACETDDGITIALESLARPILEVGWDARSE